jgi:hypothetical protein
MRRPPSRLAAPSAALVLALTLGAGCRSKSFTPEPVGPGQATASREHAVASRVDALGQAAEKAGADCGQLAAGLDRWEAANRAELPGLIEQARAEAQVDEAELARIEARIEAVLTAVLDAVDRCEGDAASQAAWSRVDALLAG